MQLPALPLLLLLPLPAASSQCRWKPLPADSIPLSAAHHGSWETGETCLTWPEALAYCQARGQRMASLDTRARKLHFLRLAGSLPLGRFFWTGGRLEGSLAARTLVWPTGARGAVTRGAFPWSVSTPSRTRAKDCVAVIHSRAGPRLFDISCQHRKPVICE
jgi:hypothetical protein